jgi:hypothetical protein
MQLGETDGPLDHSWQIALVPSGMYEAPQMD